MPKLPDPAELKRPTPQYNTAITRVRNADAIGDAVSSTAQALGEVAEDFRKRDATSKAKAAKLEYSQFVTDALYNPETGYAGKAGRDAADGYEPLKKSLEDRRKMIGDKLDDPMARELYDGASLDDYEGALKSSAGWALKGKNEYADQLSTATIGDWRQRMTLDPTNVQLRDQARIGITAEVASVASRKGLGDMRIIEQMAQRELADAYGDLVTATAIKDPAAAKDLLKLYTPELSANPDRFLSLSAAIERDLDAQTAREAAATYLDGRGPLGAAPPHATFKEGTEFFNKGILPKEAGWKNGRGLVSPKGALGVGQVMPATAEEMCKELGIKFDIKKLKDDYDYCWKIGHAYFQKQLTKFGGNVVLAAAAYNAGPGAVDKWLKTIGDPNKGEVSNAEFAKRIPFAETKDYVEGALRRAYGSNSEPIERPQESPDEAGAYARIDADPSLSAKQREAAKREVGQAASTRRRLYDQDQQDRLNKVADFIVGRNISSLASVPKSMLEGLAPRHLKTIEDMVTKTATDKVKFDPVAYNELTTLYQTDKTRFMKTNLVPYYTRLGQGEFTRFQDMQKGLTGGQETEEGASLSQINRVAGETMEAHGLSLTGTEGNIRSKRAARRAEFERAVMEDVRRWRQDTGKPPSDLDVRKMVDQRLMKVAGTDRLQFEVPSDGKVFIPQDELRFIRERAQARRGLAPTEPEVVAAWKKWKAAGGRL